MSAALDDGTGAHEPQGYRYVSHGWWLWRRGAWEAYCGCGWRSWHPTVNDAGSVLRDHTKLGPPCISSTLFARVSVKKTKKRAGQPSGRSKLPAGRSTTSSFPRVLP